LGARARLLDLDLVGLARARSAQQQRLLVLVQLVEGLVDVDAVRARHRAQQVLVVALSLDEIARELAVQRALLQRPVGMRDEQLRLAREARPEAIAVRARTGVRVEREMARLERVAQTEAAHRAGAARRELQALRRAAPDLGDHADAAGCETRGLLDGFRDAA